MQKREYDGCQREGIKKALEENSTGSESALNALLDAMLDLKPNWDSYNALPINPKAVTLAKRIAPLLHGFAVVPTPSGGVQFECSANGDDIEIEISI